MKKRVLAGLMMAVMLLASAMSVSAAPSVTKPIEPGDSPNGKYEVTTESPKFEGLTADVEGKIEKMNKGETVSVTTDIDNAIKGKKLVQKFFDIVPVDNHDKCIAQGYHTVTVKVVGMTKNWENITLIHYSPARTTWEVFSENPANPKNKLTVDYNERTLTFNVVDFSPFAIYADVAGDVSGDVSGDASGDAVVGTTSPSTQGVSSTWMLYAAMALIVLGSGVVVYQKKRG